MERRLKQRELFTLLLYFSYILLVALLTQDDITTNQNILDNPLLNYIISFKGYIFALFPLIGSMLITDVLFILTIIKPHRDLISTIGISMFSAITYVLLLGLSNLSWAVASALALGTTTFFLNLRNPGLYFSNTTEYLLNYEIVKKVIIIGTIILLVATLLSLGRFDTSNLYLTHPFIIFFLFLTQFAVTMILLLEIITLLIIYRDSDPLRISMGHIQSQISQTYLSDASLGKAIISSLNFYNKYLQRTFGVNIIPMSRIYEYIMFSTLLDKIAILTQFNTQFINGKLELIRYLRQLVSTNEDSHQSGFLSKNKTRQALNEFTNMTIPILAVLISIIDLFSK
jgi:hypothetical protein